MFLPEVGIEHDERITKLITQEELVHVFLSERNKRVIKFELSESLKAEDKAAKARDKRENQRLGAAACDDDHPHVLHFLLC